MGLIDTEATTVLRVGKSENVLDPPYFVPKFQNRNKQQVSDSSPVSKKNDFFPPSSGALEAEPMLCVMAGTHGWAGHELSPDYAPQTISACEAGAEYVLRRGGRCSVRTGTSPKW